MRQRIAAQLIRIARYLDPTSIHTTHPLLTKPAASWTDPSTYERA